MRRLFLASFLVACQPPLVISTGSAELAAPEALRFPPTALGFSRRAQVTIVNRTKASVSATLSVTGPFAVAPHLELGGGTELALDVTFAPTALGPHTGALTIEGFATVALDGEGVAPLDCGADSACRRRSFDAETLACVDEARPNGTACVDELACVEAGTCVDGACRGEVARCDDGDPCSDDACAVGRGCTHSARTCQAPTNPCLAATCDARTGCATAPVVDGTPCGAVSCVVANVCLSGQCRAVTPPDGFRCAPETPCRGEGVCRNQQCVLPPAHELTPRWTYRPPAVELYFDGVTDEAGNWYWVECSYGAVAHSGSTCTVVSRTPAGFERLRVDLGHVPLAAHPSWPRATDSARQVVAGSTFVFTTGRALVAVSTETGARRWMRAAHLERTLGLADDGHGGLWVSTRFEGETPDWALLRLDVTTGVELAKSRLFSSPVLQLISDSAGRAFAAVRPDILPDERNPPRLVRVDPDGGVGLDVVEAQGPAMMAGNALVLDDDSERDPEDGGVVQGGSSWQTRPRRGLAVGSTRWRLAVPWVVNDRDPPSVVLERNDGVARTVPFQSWGDRLSSPFLTASHDVLFASGWEADAKLRLLSGDGAERWTCDLPHAQTFVELTGNEGFNGRSFAMKATCALCFWDDPHLVFFDVGALGVAATGWVGPRGTVGGGGRPR